MIHKAGTDRYVREVPVPVLVLGYGYRTGSRGCAAGAGSIWQCGDARVALGIERSAGVLVGDLEAAEQYTRVLPRAEGWHLWLQLWKRQARVSEKKAEQWSRN